MPRLSVHRPTLRSARLGSAACLALALGWAAANLARAQEDASASRGASPQGIEAITVLGSRAHAEKPADELPVPIDLYGGVEIKRTGELDLAAALTKLAPSFNYSRMSVGDGGLLHPATLRGLGPDQTLVLVNGKRRHGMAWLRVLDGVIGYGSGGTDLRSIPSAAVGRIEVLRDGAAAQYGSDAIAGVINLVLKDHSEGGNLDAYAARTRESDGRRSALTANGGLPLGSEGGFLNLTAEWYDEDPLERNGGNGALDPNFQDELITASSPEYDNRSWFFNAELPLGAAGEVYAFGGWAQREGRTSGGYRFAYNYWDGLMSGAGGPGPGWDVIVPSSIHFHERNTHPVYPDGFLPYEESEVEDFSLALGWRGELAGWEVDASAAYGNSEFRFSVSNSINASVGANYLADHPGASLAEIVANAGPLAGDSGAIEFDQLTLNLDLRRAFEIGGRPLYAAAGLERRDENYRQKAGDPASWSCGLPHNPNHRAPAVGPDGTGIPGAVASCGFQGYPGYSPRNAQLSHEDRDSHAVYFELELGASDALTLGAALRWEDYDDAGQETTGKLTTRLAVSDRLALRGAFSSGFRAPGLSQRRFNAILFVGSEEGLTTTFGVPEGHAVARAFGVDALEHETSRNWSTGLVWNPAANLRLTLDAYRIEIGDRIVRARGIGCAELPACRDAGFGKAAFFFNGIDTETQGLDLVGQWLLPLAGGELGLSASAHFNRTRIAGEHRPAGAPEDLSFGDYFGGWPADLLERGQPRQQLSLAADWENESWGATLRLNRYGRSVQHPLDTGRVTIGAAHTVDVEGRYDLGRGLRLTLGASNLFDELPDELDKTHLSNLLWGIRYPNDTPFGLAGTLWYARLSYRF